MATKLHPYEAAQRRAEIAAAVDNLSGLRGTLQRFTDEADYVREQWDSLQGQIYGAKAAAVQANRQGGVIDFSGRAGAPSYLGFTDRPERQVAQLALERALADCKGLEAGQAPWTARAAQLDHLLARVRRAIRLQTPHVEGLLKELAAMDAPEPEPVPAVAGSAAHRLQQLGTRVAEWAAP